MPDRTFAYKGVSAAGEALKPIPYRSIDLHKPWNTFDLSHDLTKKGIERFVADFEGAIRPASGG